MWIARDKNEELYVYFSEKPVKIIEEGYWKVNNGDFDTLLGHNIFKDIIDLNKILWEDKEPTEIILKK